LEQKSSSKQNNQCFSRYQWKLSDSKVISQKKWSGLFNLLIIEFRLTLLMELMKVLIFVNVILGGSFVSNSLNNVPMKPNIPTFTHAVIRSYYRSVMVKPSEQGSGFAHPIFEPQVRKRQGLRTFLKQIKQICN